MDDDRDVPSSDCRSYALRSPILSLLYLYALSFPPSRLIRSSSSFYYRRPWESETELRCRYIMTPISPSLLYPRTGYPLTSSLAFFPYLTFMRVEYRRGERRRSGRGFLRVFRIKLQLVRMRAREEGQGLRRYFCSGRPLSSRLSPSLLFGLPCTA